MAVSLKKGEYFSLKDIENLVIGLGWDQYREGNGFIQSIFKKKTNSIDCDSTAILCKDGKLQSGKDIVFFANLDHDSKAVLHLGDNLTGIGAGDDEQILVDLKLVPECYDKIYFAANIFQCVKREQHFGMIRNAFIRIMDANSKKEICRYNLSDNYDKKTAIIFGELSKNDESWKFHAIGEGTFDTGIREMVRKFR